MDEYFKQLPQKIQTHIKEVAKSVSLPEDENPIDTLAQVWLEKKKMFEEQIHNLHMEEVAFLGREDKRGALILTYSGSLISLGILTEQRRMVEYASIGLRKDVPEIAKKDDAGILTDLNSDQIVEFADGPIKKSSPVLKIAVCGGNVS